MKKLEGQGKGGYLRENTIVKCQEIIVFHSSQVDTHPTGILMSLKSEFILHWTPGVETMVHITLNSVF